MITTEFYPIAGHPGYSISKDGRVYSHSRNKLLKLDTQHGCYRKSPTYCRVRIDKKKCRVHQLVLDTFVGPKPKGWVVNHKDGDKQNNHVDNLEYVTSSYNQNHALICGLFGDRKAQMSLPDVLMVGHHKFLQEDEVRKIRMEYDRGIKDIWELAKEYGKTMAGMRKIVNRITWPGVEPVELQPQRYGIVFPGMVLRGEE